MNWSMIRNEIARNKVIHLALFAFMMCSAALAALAVLTGVQTVDSIGAFYRIAAPPHFLQMHKGELDQDAVGAFMEEHGDPTHWQVVKMIDVYPEQLRVEGDAGARDLSDLRLDVGLVRQNPARDLLLDADHRPVHLSPGEIGMPVLLQERYDMQIGDRVTLQAGEAVHDFTIAEIVLDAQMNYTLCSSTRILLSDEDFRVLDGTTGESEYLIEAWFDDPSFASAFMNDYESSNLPAGGQAITYSMIFLLSAFSDLATVFFLLVVSLLLVLVSFLCIRFAMLAAMQEELSQIGTMKAIGLSHQDIRSLYGWKYRVLAVAACLSGYGLALLGSAAFTQRIRAAFGASSLSVAAIVAGILAAGICFGAIELHARHILNRMKGISVTDALVRQRGFERTPRAARDGLHAWKGLSLNGRMGLREMVLAFPQWSVIVVVVALAVAMMAIPHQLTQTLRSPRFVSYMGSAPDDIRIEIDASHAMEETGANARRILDADERVLSYGETRRVRATATDAQGEPFPLRIDFGERAGRHLRYLEGEAPMGREELALSLLNAQALGAGTGDELVVSFGSGRVSYRVSGIYQDVTSGGYTAKVAAQRKQDPSERIAFSVRLAPGTDLVQTARAWDESMGAGARVDPMEAFLDQTLGGVIRQIDRVVLAIGAVAIILIALVCALFLKLRLAKDRAAIGCLRAIGFTRADIRAQYLVRMGTLGTLGIAAGAVLARVLGERMIHGALAFAGLGIRSVELAFRLAPVHVWMSALLIGIIAAVTIVSLGTGTNERLREIIGESN